MKPESENLMGADAVETITRRSAIRTAGQAASFAGLTLTAFWRLHSRFTLSGQ
jgi:hypothetical protein